MGNNGTGASGDPSVTSVEIVPGEYRLRENTVSGYMLTSIDCDGSDVDGLDGLVIENAENVTCVFVNDDQGIDLEINKQVNDTSPNLGDVVTFTLTIVNNGPDQATNVEIVDQLPAGFTYETNSISGGSSNSDSDPSGAGLQWTLDTLPSGSSITLSFNAAINAQ